MIALKLSPRVGRLLATMLLGVGAASLFVWPLPMALVTTCCILGLMAGVTRLVWPDEFLAQAIGIVAVLAAAVWAPNAAHALRPTLGWPWWQPALLALAAQVVPGLTLAAVRRASAPRTI